ncbi:MAG TPA: CopD family protein [Burkholderiales bacterium]|nr:CopD family protein [Burkholderiales bacterium]
MTALIVARAVHYAAAVQLFGGLLFVLSILPARMADRLPRFQRWLRSLLLGSAVVALVSWLAWLVFVVDDITGSSGAAIDPHAVMRMLSATAFGHVWLLRAALYVLVLAMLASTRAMIARGRIYLLAAAIVAGVAIASLAGSGHAAAQTDWAKPIAIGSDALHLLGAGAWLGALLPFAFALFATTSPAAAERVARRFSAMGIAAVVVIIASGILDSTYLVASWPGLLGTPYGHWLLVKLALLACMLMLAAANRRGTPSLGLGNGAAAQANRRIARNASIEAAFGAGVLAIVAVLGASTPAAHEQPYWPLPFRLVFGDGMPTVVRAYPTSFVEPPVRYTATAIAQGLRLYERHCVSCHGLDGHGDGVAAATLTPHPADFTSAHVLAHTPGDLFWWISHGIEGTAMPGFAATLDEQQRWELVHVLRTMADAHQLDASPTAAAIAAPAFTYQIDDQPQATVPQVHPVAATLIVLYTLPSSARRLAELAEASHEMQSNRIRIVALSLAAGEGSGNPQADAASASPDVITAYRLLTNSPHHAVTHVEFLVDKDGWLRARWIASASPSIDALIRLVNTLPQVRSGMGAAAHAHHP